MNWANFSFGPLSPIQQRLFEDQPDLAFQRLTDFFGGQNGQNTAFGRWMQNQQRPLFNRYVNQAAADPTAGLTWTKFLENQSGQMPDQFQNMPGYMRGSNPGMFRVRRELW